MGGERHVTTLGACVALGTIVVMNTCAAEAGAAGQKDWAPNTVAKELPFSPGQVLFGVKEGKDPNVILQEMGLGPKRLQRVHAIQPVVARYKRFLKAGNAHQDSAGGYRFRGKHYQDIDSIDDGDVFQEALQSMSPQQRTLYRDYKATFAKEIDVRQVVARLQKRADVQYAQLNYLNVLHATPLPSVSYIPDDYYLEDDLNPGYWREQSWGQDYPDLWGLQKIQAIEAWNEFNDPAQDPGQDVIVAVVDTGVWADHPDLVGNIFTNINDPVGDADGDGDPDDDGNGFIDAAVDTYGCVVVFSAGNSGDDVKYYSPANYAKSIGQPGCSRVRQQARKLCMCRAVS